MPRADLPGYYRHADLVVMTSKSEGIPVVLMEAMAQERLVLAPAITGIPELVDAPAHGISLPAGLAARFRQRRPLDSTPTRPRLAGIQRAAAASIAASYNRQRNLRAFADQFLTRYFQPNRAVNMRILYCNKYDYPFSGTEAYLFDLIQRMDERGHETALFSMDHGRDCRLSPAAVTAFLMSTSRIPTPAC